MVTGSKKSEAPAAKAKAAAKPKTSVKSSTSKKTTAKAPAAKKSAAKPKASAKSSAKPKATGKSKTTKVVVAPISPRRVGEMVYNDELLESMAEMILSGGKADLTPALPEIKKQLFDYDIYLVSFLSDGEIGEIGAKVAELSKANAKDLTARLLTVRESARAFVGIAVKHNSVRAYIDSVIQAEGREAGLSRVREAFLAGEYCIADVDSATCESFLLSF
ncbi:hypothetical protein [Methanocella sp. MCL-LM]|uniref:hypothetical protein n=1 Tax=Methanocella sp. MCL-LM TaxID=3412035 RepID=UPI003C7233DA